MPRRADITPRVLEADPVHSSTLVTQFINAVMLDGKRSTAEKLVYDALAIVAEKTGKPPVEALESAVKTVTPVLEVRSRRVGGANYQVPVEVHEGAATMDWMAQEQERGITITSAARTTRCPARCRSAARARSRSAGSSSSRASAARRGCSRRSPVS